MNEQKNTNSKGPELLDKTVDIDPIAVIYNITGSYIEDFVYNYLTNSKHIDGVAAVRVHVVRDGSAKPEVSLYVFLNNKSSDLTSNMQNIPQHIRKRMDAGNYRANDKLRNALYPLCREFKLGIGADGLVYVKCDIFKSLGLMLAADPRVHSISITEVGKLRKKNSILTIVKSNKFIDREDAERTDKFHNIISAIED